MPLFSLLLFSCTNTPIVEPSAQLWQGWVYDDIPSDNTLGLEQGAIHMTTLEDEVVFAGEQRDENRLGMWSFEVEPNVEVSIRVEGSEHYPTVWRTRTPYAEAYWYSGAFFGIKSATFDTFLESLAELTDDESGATDVDEIETEEDAPGVHLYGEPLPLTANDVEAWTDARITVYDGEGHIHEAVSLVLDEATGGLALPGPEPSPVAAFVATNLAAGPIALVVDASDGRSTVVEYNAQPGDLLSAFAFTLPLEPQ